MTPDAHAVEDELLAVALVAAEAAAGELMARFGGPLEVSTKSTGTDPVSEADVAAEQAIRAVLAARRPGDAILGEEGGLTPAGDGAGATGLRWVVDPLDGTVNYLYGIPQFAVSVAVEDGEGGLAGVIVDPVAGEWFSATRSGPALRRSKGRAGAHAGDAVVGDGEAAVEDARAVPLTPRRETRLDHALVATGFGYDATVRAAQGEVAAALLPRVRDLRRAGAAALDLCAVASGRVDAYFERGVKPWDVAAGVLVCRRVGLEVRVLEAKAATPGAEGRDQGADLPAGIVVAPAALIDELLEIVGGPTVD